MKGLLQQEYRATSRALDRARLDRAGLMEEVGRLQNLQVELFEKSVKARDALASGDVDQAVEFLTEEYGPGLVDSIRQALCWVEAAHRTRSVLAAVSDWSRFLDDLEGLSDMEIGHRMVGRRGAYGVRSLDADRDRV